MVAKGGTDWRVLIFQIQMLVRKDQSGVEKQICRHIGPDTQLIMKLAAFTAIKRLGQA